MGDMGADKVRVRDFWDAASCGEALFLHGDGVDPYCHQLSARYALEPYIAEFAAFQNCSGKEVLEIGVGLGADHQRFAEAGAVLTGIDLTARAIRHTASRFEALGLASRLQVADAENLPYSDNTYDLVYSWGVLHHSPDTQKAIDEVYRVLKPGAQARIMIYHKYSMVGYMLWLRYALLRLRPLTSLARIYAEHLESPGTKAYTVAEAREMLSQFSHTKIETVLTHGDLLKSEAGQRHRGVALSLAKAIWPRALIRRLLPTSGLFMLITATK